jgi:RNA-directed DNA polymerase
MYNRAAQALVTLALEPEWEAHFEPNSYGFRPGRSCHDAISAIFNSLSRKAKYVLDADIAKCFDRINHSALLEKLHTFPKLRQVIKAWLKAGVVDNGELFPTEEGTPQGGVCSPLLMNVGLHGLETAIEEAYPQHYKAKNWRPTVVRYADDLVVLHPELTVIEQIKQQVSQWLTQMGLEFKASKTRIAHTLYSQLEPTTQKVEEAGFDFLGFNIRQYPQGKTHSARAVNRWGASQDLGFKLLIRPSKKAIARHLAAVKGIIRRHKTARQAALIAGLKRVLQGWTRYYSTVASSRIFSKLEHLMFLRLASWAKRRHSNKSWQWISHKYWRLETGHWEFTDREKASLYRYYQTPIRRHIKVQESKSVYDGDWLYWATRMGRHPEVTNRVAMLLKRQKGRCQWCGLYFKNGDLKEVDHNQPLKVSNDKKWSNWQLLHGHCHDQKTARDGSLLNRGTRNKSRRIEEPDDANVSRPVLKTSRGGDALA